MMMRARRQFSCWGIRVVLATLVVLALGAVTDGARAEDPSPPLVQAGFITKFPLYVTWPAEPWRSGDAPFVVGVLGEAPVRRHLDELARYVTIDGSPLEVRSVTDPSEYEQCQLLFIVSDPGLDLEGLLAGLDGKPVLTVSAEEGFAQRGVHINFYLEGQYVRFEINQRASEAAGLAVSFRLSNVARLVE